MQGAYLLEAQLQGASLTSAQLQGAYLFGAQLQGADLSKARLQGAYLCGANLCATQLQFAIINYYNEESEQYEAILLTEAILDETDKYKNDLPNFDEVKNIDSAKFSDHEETNQKVIAKIKQKHNLP